METDTNEANSIETPNEPIETPTTPPPQPEPTSTVEQTENLNEELIPQANENTETTATNAVIVHEQTPIEDSQQLDLDRIDENENLSIVEDVPMSSVEEPPTESLAPPPAVATTETQVDVQAVVESVNVNTDDQKLEIDDTTAVEMKDIDNAENVEPMNDENVNKNQESEKLDESQQQQQQLPSDNVFSLLKNYSENVNDVSQVQVTKVPTVDTSVTDATAKAKRNVAVKNSQAGLNKLLGQGPQGQTQSAAQAEPQRRNTNEHLIIDDENDDLVQQVSEKVDECPVAKTTQSWLTAAVVAEPFAPRKSILSQQNIAPASAATKQTKAFVNGGTPSVPLQAQHQNISPSAKVLAKALSTAIITPVAITTSNSSITTTTTSSSTGTNVTVKQFKNKIVSCKPFYQSKATECVPLVKDASTQIDLDDLKPTYTIIPVPVPINVPLPMCMYQAPMPVPIPIPIPIPVPVFIPTTKRTYERVQRRIKKLRKKLPSDPSEFQILLYAEQLAREEGIPGFEDSSDGDSDTDSVEKKAKADKKALKDDPTQQVLLGDQDSAFKWMYGVRIFNTWLNTKSQDATPKLPNDLLKLRNDELNSLLAEFIHVIRKPNGETYAPESIYYLCLGIQYYLQENSRVENIFLDMLFEKFQESLNDVSVKYQIRIGPDGQIISRIEEEILWESRQLGAHSPFILLNTILYFNTKYFFLDKTESHLQLSFTNVKKHSKRNIGPNGEEYGKTVYLRYYPDFHGIEQVIYEQGENYENPLRCPVKLYEFYLSKCPESVKNRSDVFYLLPERACTPTSPVWFSSQPLPVKTLERMLNRIKMVKEVNELLIAASQPQTATTTP